jgi:hypothetical protein
MPIFRRKKKSDEAAAADSAMPSREVIHQTYLQGEEAIVGLFEKTIVQVVGQDAAAHTKSKTDEVLEPDKAEITLEPAAEIIAYGRLWKVGLAAAVVAAVANLFIYAAATTAGIPLVVPASSGAAGEMVQMSAGSVIIASAMAGIGATLLLAFFGISFFRGRLPRPTHILWGVSFFTWFFSLAGPLSLPVSTKSMAVMCLMHTVAAVVIVGILTIFGREKKK